MSDDQEPPVKSRVPLRLGLLLGGLLLYVLSVGPVSWAFNRTNWIPPEWLGNALGAFYFPLAWSAEQLPWFEALLQWYMEIV
jgi:hypothetical protein